MCPNKVKMLQGGEPMNHGEMALKPMGYFGHRRRKSIYSCEFVMPGPGEPAWLTGHNQTGSSVFFFFVGENFSCLCQKRIYGVLLQTTMNRPGRLSGRTNPLANPLVPLPGIVKKERKETIDAHYAS
jgi:hypothetical protein